MAVRELLWLEKTRIRLLKNSILKSGAPGKFLALSILAAFFVAGDYLFFRRMLTYMVNLPLEVGELLVIQLLNLLCLTIFSMLVFSNIVASISTLYMSRDLDLLISSPLPILSVFSSKCILTFINSSWMAALFGAPVFIAYGEVYFATWWYYAALPMVMLPFLLIPSAAGILATMSLMRFFPARRTHQVLSFVGLVFIAGLVMFFRFLEPEKFLGKKDISDEEIFKFIDKLKAPDYEWMPSSMTAKSLQASAMGDWTVLGNNLAWLWIMAAAAIAILVVMGGWIYYDGLSASHGSRETGVPDGRRLFYRALARALVFMRPQARAIIMKDMKIFWRDTAQWSQLFMLAALVIVYLFNVRNLPLETFYLKAIVSVMNIGLAGVVLAAVAARFVFPTTSVEGRVFWAIHAAPVDFKLFLWSKYFFYTIPILLFGEILVVASNILLSVDMFVMAVSSAAIAMVAFGLTGLGVGMGALYPKFDYENIAEVGVTSGAIIYMVLSMAYIGAVVMLAAGPVYEHLMKMFYLNRTAGLNVWLSYPALVLLCAACVYLPMRMGVSALKKMES
ncbi:MAG: hypothetical protein HZB29_02330 [Nitrospinae bacterium]|nr:hypothetical protein [Nitrospinota bacterium]